MLSSVLMERRGFISGLFGGVTAAGLIVKATQADLEAFASPLKANAPIVLDTPRSATTTVGEHLYNSRGELVAVVTDVTVSIGLDHGRVFDDVWAQMHSVREEITITATATGIGRVVLDLQPDNKSLTMQLRGRASNVYDEARKASKL